MFNLTEIRALNYKSKQHIANFLDDNNLANTWYIYKSSIIKLADAVVFQDQKKEMIRFWSCVVGFDESNIAFEKKETFEKWRKERDAIKNLNRNELRHMR